MFKFNKKPLTWLTFLFGMGLFLSLFPIIICSFYSHPFADDFGYSEKVHNVIKNGGGLFGALSASLSTVKTTYSTWQGTYAAVFIFSIQPAAFSEKLYFLTTFVMLTALIFSTMFFINTVFSILHYNKQYGFIIACIILLLSIHLVEYKMEAFYWWNGCSYYTLFYSFSLIFFAIIIKLYFANTLAKKIVYYIISIVFAILLGGGNYSTSLLTTLIFLIVIILLIKHKKKFLCITPIFIVMLIGFIVSICAPGNKVRASSVTGKSPFSAIFFSVFNAIKLMGKWTNLITLVGFFAITVFAFLLTKKTTFKFKYPFLVLIFSVLVYSAQLTPPLFGMGYIGDGRQINIYFYSYFILVSFNIFYFCGWINKKEILKKGSTILTKKNITCGILILSFIFTCGCLNFGIRRISFIETSLSLKNHIPQNYNVEYVERIKDLENNNTEIDDINTVPSFFSKFCIENDPNYWINIQMAKYYNVDKITLKPN